MDWTALLLQWGLPGGLLALFVWMMFNGKLWTLFHVKDIMATRDRLLSVVDLQAEVNRKQADSLEKLTDDYKNLTTHFFNSIPIPPSENDVEPS